MSSADVAEIAGKVDYDQLLNWLGKRLNMLGYKDDLWAAESENSKAMVEFITGEGPKTLSVTKREDAICMFCDKLGQSVQTSGLAAYFLRPNIDLLTTDNITSMVQYGSVGGKGLSIAAFENVMRGVVEKQISSNTELTSHFHRCMATLTDTVHYADGLTVLYCPSFENQSIPEVAQDTDRLQIIVNIVIHWSHQIKAVVNSHDSSATAETAGPLDEIEFWKGRAKDLLGIQKQLENPNVIRIIEILQYAKSNYVGSFQQLTEQILTRATEANDNLKYLETIRQQCTDLRTIEPEKIVTVLPDLLNRIRLIWTYSSFYDDNQHIGGLLKKVSNEIIRRFRAHISIPEILDGDVEFSIARLLEAIHCSDEWRNAYKKTVAAIARNKHKHQRTWDIEDANVFAQISAFVGYCKELIEVCQCQMQFVRKSGATGGNPGPIPIFGGTQATEIVEGIRRIEATFETHVERLRKLDYAVLDVRSSRWNDDFPIFINAILDLDLMYISVITSAFSNVSTVAEGVNLVEIFHRLAKREAIRRSVMNKAADMQHMFITLVRVTREEMDQSRNNPPLRPHEPQYAGSALWAHSLGVIVKEAYDHLVRIKYILLPKDSEEAREAYSSFNQVINDFKLNRYNTWKENLKEMAKDNGLQVRLEKHLLRRAESDGQARAGTEIVCNFDEELLTLFAEVSYWEKFHGEFSTYEAHDICNKKELLRVMREHVMVVVRAYNDIVRDIGSDEKRLFLDHMRKLDRHIGQGLTKLTWQSKNMIEMYVRDCVATCTDVHSIVKDLKECKSAVAKLCKQLSTMSLLRVDKNHIYGTGVFEAHQAEQRKVMRVKYRSVFDSILKRLRTMYRNFRDGSNEVQKEWRQMINGIDTNIEQSLKQAVRRSFQELSKAINGDSKTVSYTLFTIQMILSNDLNLTYSPSVLHLAQSMGDITTEMINVTKEMPRIRVQTFDPDAKASDLEIKRITDQTGKIKSICEVITNDEDIVKSLKVIMNGVATASNELDKHLDVWKTQYHVLWEKNKDEYIREFMKGGKKTPEQFDAAIKNYRAKQDTIIGDISSKTFFFIKVDHNILKDALVGHCQQYQTKLTGLLNQIGATEINEIFQLFKKSKDFLTVAPKDLDELGAKLNTCKDLKEQLGLTKGRFEPVRMIFSTLSDNDVNLKEDELAMLNGLDEAFDDFVQMIQDSEKGLEKSKVAMKRDLESQMEAYSTQMTEQRATSQTELPYSDEFKPEQALAKIQEYKTKITKAKERKDALAVGQQIFGLPVADHKDLVDLVRDVDLLSQIWTLTAEWGDHWESWKNGQFGDLNVEEMENVVGQSLKKVGKLGRDIKSWKVWEAMKTELDKFRETIPLIQDLRSPALRPRHWASLQERVGKEFNPQSPEFTLNEVVKLGLNAHSEFIGELSANATKELNIEIQLDDLETRWQTVEMDIGIHKEKFFKFKGVEDIMQILGDDSVQLSNFKATKFYGSFQTRIDDWDGKLSLISEVIDAALNVQRKWIYLENIFTAGEVAKDLPSESAMFRRVNTDFTEVMGSFYNNPIALQSCTVDGLLQSILDMDAVLEKIQKSLDSFLADRRNAFPRFYFISDDDLLEILGQSKDPHAVQAHIKKCFEGIKTLKMIPPGGPDRLVDAVQMNAPDGETAAFAEAIPIEGPVEIWLNKIEAGMRKGLSKLLSIALQKAAKGKKEKLVKDTIGQLLITAGAILWTADCERALKAIATGTKGAMKSAKKKQVSYYNKLVGIIGGQLSKIDRNKVVALITMEIHNRDVMEKMVKANCTSPSDFEWLSQLRFIYDKNAPGFEFGKCEVRQTNSVLEYSCEYQGNNGRLVVTPLTDRCVLTLITAMYLNRGGNPLGPAGTGKTETVKDLGKNLAKYVVVINCSDGMNFRSMGLIFSGLCQSGSWGCFDEFNRIKIEVISVVAMQILSILNAMSAKMTHFNFMGQVIPCNPNCGVFITMNPGYAGRTELPDNLKAIMRPVAMMQPDLTMIAEVMLASEGFIEGKIMAKKTVTLYQLMIQQLSKQDHYDYGLRNLKAVLNMAGQLKRNEPTMSEEAILMRALRDMNLPKFIKDDERLFRLLLGDLFPNLELPVSEYGTLLAALEAELVTANLQRQEFLLMKIFQLYDSRLTRHCNMLVGNPCGGKSTAWRTLANAQTTLSKNGVEGFSSVTPYIINPKSIELNELYGEYDMSTFEWRDGILSKIFKNCSNDERPYEKWVLFDGPIDAMWIESMNSVMDDNKILTLINGDRIPLTNTMSLVFETQDLRVASPATVSRAGMIYIDSTELPWETFVQSWLNAKFGPESELKAFYLELFDKWVPKILKFKATQCNEPVKISDFSAIMSFCSLFDALCKAEPSFDKGTLGGDYNSVAEKMFLFTLTWSIGGAVDENSRRKLNAAVSDIDAVAPAANTLYDYFVDVSKNDFIGWDTRVPNWRPVKGMTFHDMIVPTVDTVRNTYIVETLIRHKRHIAIVGATGTGKTILAQDCLKRLPDGYTQLTINFSAATTSLSVQDIVEASLVKRSSKDRLGPADGKNMVVFIDDFNMPKLSSLDSPFQPPLELVRLWVDYTGWYDRVRCDWKAIVDTQLMVGMGHPGGGRNQICPRTQSRFSVINCTFPADSQIVRIFESILSSKFVEFDNEIKQLSTGITLATLKVYKAVSSDFLMTPEKFTYLFNIRDVAKVIQGLLMVTQKSVDSPEGILRLWIHECQRVFSDRFVRTKSNDEQKFRDILAAKMNEAMQKDWGNIMSDALEPKIGPLFCGFLSGSEDEVVYEEVHDYKKMRSVVEEKLEDYNMEPKLLSMELAMFRDAIMHVCRIHRVIVQPRGNLMLVGIGGSGRSSLARLASYTAGMSVFSIEITKNYRLIEFREDVKKLYMSAGCDNKPTVFLFNDTQIKEESFLEDINNILSSGIVPNLFAKDECQIIYDAVRKPAVTAGYEETSFALWNYFIDRVRSNLHVILAMSPIGDGLRNRCRMYPGLVNCTTIDWFHTWPAEALQEVAMKFLDKVEVAEDSYREKIATIFAEMHLSVINASDRMKLLLKRFNYVTPTNYLELVKGYRTLLKEKSTDLGSSATKLANGLAKLEDARSQVETLSKELEVKKVVVAQSQKDCEDLLVKIVSEKRIADEQKKQVEADQERIGQEAIECKAMSDAAEADVAAAMPALNLALKSVDELDKSMIQELKGFTNPHPLVKKVMEPVMILFGKATDWNTAKRIMGEANFVANVKGYPKEILNTGVQNKIKKYVEDKEFIVEDVKGKSMAAAALCAWVHAIYTFSNVLRDVNPARQRAAEAAASMQIKMEALAEAQAKLKEVMDKLDDLKNQYDTSTAEKNQLRDEAQNLEDKLDRADKLVNGLAGEYVRWQASIGGYNAALVKVVGDALIAAAFLSYAGPFDTKYRTSLQEIWRKCVHDQKLPVSDNFDFATFLANPTDVRDWNIQGLPKDDFSTENGVISTRGNRWPLMIDPQGQANRWIRNMEGARLRIIDLKMTGFLQQVEASIQYGFPVLLQDILEEIDPALEPVLSKSILKIGNREVLRLGDKELDYSRDFRMYITTKLSNPHYTPEISTKATVVNFAVKKDGLEAQLLGIVFAKEEPKLEKKKGELTIMVANNKRTLVELEDMILKLLSESTGSLLDDVELVDTLQKSKITSEEVTQQLISAEETEKQIDGTRTGYKAAAVRASLVYFVMDDMSRVDPMYQFSLDSYVDLFNNSMDNSHMTSLDITSEKRCFEINTYHTLSVYQYTCRALFERHKLLFSFQLCIKIMEAKGDIVEEEYAFFCYGSGLSDRSMQKNNPGADWLPNTVWDAVNDLDKIGGFSGIVASFEQMPRDWKAWYMSGKPEVEPMPSDWSTKTSELQKLCIVRACRLDRVLFAAAKFVQANIGQEFVEPPSFDLGEVYKKSNNKTPLIFVLSPGVDPTAGIMQLASQLETHMDNCALGQGQEVTATRLLETGLKQGNWVFLANCHLMLSWMPALEKIIEAFVEGDPHPNFRLWLSSSPDPNFPITILQRGLKMTTEPPRGLRSNMLTLFNTISDDQFMRCGNPIVYRKLLFCLAWFHAILLERRKFKSLGFNIPYDFNGSDFDICHDLVIVFLDEYPDRIPFDAMKYLIAEANYGGRVTDDWDRRLVNVYIAELFCDECVQSETFPLSDLPDYMVPHDPGAALTLRQYKDLIKGMPPTDHPLAFGQHSNSDMAASIDDAATLIDTLVSLQPRMAQVVDDEAGDPLARQCQELLETTPELFDAKDVRERMEVRTDPDPLKTVLFQEVDRYNKLLGSLRSSLSTIIKVQNGTASTTVELEEVILGLQQLKVPRSWGKTYPSVKPLGPWMKDVVTRIEFFNSWINDNLPATWWLPAMTFPTGFLTAVLQVSARANAVSIDSLIFETPVLTTMNNAEIRQPARDGVFIYGIYLEGATWNVQHGILEESRPMELISHMPVIHFKPVEGRRRTAKGYYTCPLYMYPVRTGTRERPSYVSSVDLKVGKQSSDYWTKRGVAMLLSIAS